MNYRDPSPTASSWARCIAALPMQHITSVALPLAQPPCAAPSDGGGASSSSSRPTGTRILYIILSANSNSSNLRLAAIEKGAASVTYAHAMSSLCVRTTRLSEGRQHPRRPIDGRLLLDAANGSSARRSGGLVHDADDDTHVDPDAIIDFVQHSDPSLAYGNLYNFRNATRGDPKTFLPKTPAAASAQRSFRSIAT